MTFEIIRHHRGYMVREWEGSVFVRYMAGEWTSARAARAACIAVGATDADIRYSD